MYPTGALDQTVYLPSMRRRRSRQVQEYHGGPIPLGMHLEARRSRGLMVLGGLLFAVPYLGGAAAAAVCSGSLTCTGSFGWLVIPVVGPFVAAPIAQSDGDRVALLVDGVVQTAGLGIFVAAVVMTRQVLVDDPYAATGFRGLAWHVTPFAPQTLGGVSFDFRF